MLRIGTGLLLLTLLAGCASQRPMLERPEVRLANIEVMELSLREQRIRLSFEADNPNPYPLPVEKVRYRLFLEQQAFASGESGARFTVPANGRSQFDISVELDLMRSATQLATLLREGAHRPLNYELHGSLAVAIPFARPLSFSREGSIALN